MTRNGAIPEAGITPSLRPRTWRRAVLAALVAVLGLGGLASCSTVGYYWQGVRGQAELLVRSEPIDQVLASDPDRELRRKLELVVAVRRFASEELGLPDNRSYRSYVDLRRPYVVWNVFAAPELSLEPKKWCFPIAGCVSYRGFFDEEAARAEAARLRGEGYDVHVGGVPAYSTLGYFDDPVLNTFIHYPDYEVARLIFHELAHQVVYVRDDTEFNESFASTVEEVGVERWLAAHPSATGRARFERMQSIRAGFRALVSGYRARLEALYASGVDTAAMRRRKAELFGEMRADHERLKAEAWGGYSGYDAWFARADNASLAAVGLYTDRVPAFRSLLARVHGDLPRFYAEVKKLADAPAAGREAALASE